MPTNRSICLRYLRDSIRYSVSEDSSFRRAAFPKDYMCIMIRGQLSTNQGGKYACTQKRVHLSLHDSNARGFVNGKRAASRGAGEE